MPGDSDSKLAAPFALHLCPISLAATGPTLLLQAAAQGRQVAVAVLQQHTVGRVSCTAFVETSFIMGEVNRRRIAHTAIANAHAKCWKPYLVDMVQGLSSVTS